MQVLDSGIKLPPGAEVFPVDVLQLRPTQLAVGMQQARPPLAPVPRPAPQACPKRKHEGDLPPPPPPHGTAP